MRKFLSRKGPWAFLLFAPASVGTNNFLNNPNSICLKHGHKKLAILILIFIISAHAGAQDSLQVKDSTWRTGGNFNINLSQVALANWAGGGESALSLGTLFGYFAHYEKRATLWKSGFNTAYGLQKSNGRRFRKTDDQIQLVTELSRKLRNPQWLWTARVNFWSQIARGFIYSSDPDVADEEISRFMAPGYLQAAMGYSYSEPKIFTLSIFPLTGKFTFVVKDSLATRYGLNEGENVRAEFGASLNANLTRSIMENVKVTTNLNLFANYDRLTRVDVNWDMVLLMKVNKYITTSIAAQLIYDHEIDVSRDREGVQRRIQFKELINVGFAYDFGHKRKK